MDFDGYVKLGLDSESWRRSSLRVILLQLRLEFQRQPLKEFELQNPPPRVYEPSGVESREGTMVFSYFKAF